MSKVKFVKSNENNYKSLTDEQLKNYKGSIIFLEDIKQIVVDDVYYGQSSDNFRHTDYNSDFNENF